MQVGISTACLYPQLLEESFEEVGRLGLDCTEVFFNTFSELSPEYLGLLRGIQDRCRLNVRAIHPFTSGFEPFLFFTGYERRYRDGIEAYERYFETAAALGAQFVVFHGDHRLGQLEPERYFEHYVGIARRAKTFGVTLAQENVARCRSGSLSFLTQMKRELGEEAAFVLDLKQAIRAGENLWKMVEVLGERIVHVHLSDHDDESDCLPVGDGKLDTGRLVQALRQKNFDGALMIELYRSNFSDLNNLYQSYLRVKAILENRSDNSE